MGNDLRHRVEANLQFDLAVRNTLHLLLLVLQLVLHVVELFLQLQITLDTHTATLFNRLKYN